MSPRPLVVYLPGIVGSRLDEPDGDGRWSVGALRGTYFDPSTLDIDRPLVPAGLMPDLAVVQALPRVPRYRRLFRQIEGLGGTVATALPRTEPNPNADFIAVPYDFRRSIADAAQYLDEMVERWRADRPVIVVAHSMGGLVAHYWISVLAGWRVCDRLLTLGTPFRGAPKALAWLTGQGKLGGLSTPQRITDVIRKWPSMYELLPRYTVIEDGTEHRRPHELDLPGLHRGMAEAAYRVHERMDDDWADIPEQRRPTIVAYYSYGHATLGRATLVDNRLRVTKDDPEWHSAANPRPLGDGTVPGLSAIPWQLDDKKYADFHHMAPKEPQHMAIATTEAITQNLGKYWNIPKEPVRGPDERPPWLGLDLDEQFGPGEPVSIGARLCETTPDERTSFEVQIRAGSDTGACVAKTRLVAGGDDWYRTTLDPLPAGEYHVRVEAARVPGTQVRPHGAFTAVLPEGSGDE